MNNIYRIDMKVDLKNLNHSTVLEFNKELFKALPKDVIRISYICSSCGNWMGSEIDSLCDLCLENYDNDLKSIKEGCASYEHRLMVEHYKEKLDKSLCVYIETKLSLDEESALNNFKSGKYIKSMGILKIDEDEVSDLFLEHGEVKISEDMYIFLED